MHTAKIMQLKMDKGYNDVVNEFDHKRFPIHKGSLFPMFLCKYPKSKQKLCNAYNTVLTVDT